jgi:CRP/FNR family transcriptional regulator
MSEDGAFRSDVLTAVARRFADYEQLVEDVALTGFDARLARVLLRLAQNSDEIRTTHDALAAETASGRAFVTRRLREFARLGLVETQRGQLRLLDRAGLEWVAQDET